jgi:hypothetical protein
MVASLGAYAVVYDGVLQQALACREALELADELRPSPE